MLDDDRLLKILLPARDVPDGARVQKARGQNTFVLRRNLTVRLLEGKDLRVHGHFLTADETDPEQVAPDRELAWLVTVSELADILREREESRDDQ